MPVLTLDCTDTAPPKMDCVAVASGLTATASTRMPEPSLNASRAAISLFSAVEEIRTAAGDACPATAASASAFGATE